MKKRIFILSHVFSLLFIYSLSSHAQIKPISHGLFDYSGGNIRRIIKISPRLMKEWNVTENILRQYRYDANTQYHKDLVGQAGAGLTGISFIEIHDRIEVIELFDDGFHFDVKLNDGIYGNYLVAPLEDYRNDGTMFGIQIVIQFDSIGVSTNAHYPQVEIIPSPPVILSPLNQEVVSAVNPTIFWKIDEVADGCGIVLFDSRPILGRYGTILWQKEYRDIGEKIFRETIPVSLEDGFEYHVIIWSYINAKYTNDHWIGAAYSMEWSSFRIDVTAGKVNALNLQQNFPNPFNNTTIILWEQDTSAEVNFTIYDILGKKVIQLLNTTKSAGRHIVTWDARNEKGMRVSTGTYILRAQIGDFRGSLKIVVLK